MHSVQATFTLPTVVNTLGPVETSGLRKAINMRATAATGASTSSSDSSSAAGVGNTFLSLLAQELQNQDPTAPVDSTAMVGQMISLNQLDQLISINQTLTSPATSTTSGSDVSKQATSSWQPAQFTNPLSPSTPGTVSPALPFDPSTMLPLGFGNSAATGSSINSSLNAATMGLSGTNNSANYNSNY